ncbi:MAG: flagellar biosynthetic protein FliO [Gammaproteobacteria bacterium]|nr:flagellar biosynthetic protein FliO [Gammaproteobacteria bacterium]MBU2478558.1 flagellar biosynthetic protein FliO [Gammaproteobacteria bacterium]
MFCTLQAVSRRHLSGVLAAGALSVFSTVVQAAETAVSSKVPALEIEPMATGNLLQMILGLIAVLMLIAGLAWVMRRMGGVTGTTAGSLRILGGLSMGTRERIVLVQVGEQQLLLGVAPGRVQTLHVLEHPIQPVEQDKSGKGAFAASLSAALQRGKQK